MITNDRRFWVVRIGIFHENYGHFCMIVGASCGLSTQSVFECCLQRRLLCINESARRLVHLQAEQEDMIALSQQTVLKLSTTTLTMTETGCDLELSVPSEVSFQQEKYSGVAFEVLEVCKSETKPLAEWLVATPVCGLISPGTSVCVHLSMSEDASSCSDLPTGATTF